MGGNRQRDHEYTALYRRILPEMDLVLWVTRTTGAALSPRHQGCHRCCCFYSCLLRVLRGNQVYIPGCIKRHVLPGLNLAPRYGNVASGRFYRDLLPALRVLSMCDDDFDDRDPIDALTPIVLLLPLSELLFS